MGSDQYGYMGYNPYGYNAPQANPQPQGQMDGGLMAALVGHVQARNKVKQDEAKRKNEAYEKAKADHEKMVTQWKQRYMRDAIKNAMKSNVDQMNEDNDVNFIKNGSGPVPQQQTVYSAYGMPDPSVAGHYNSLQTAQKILADDDEYQGMYGSK